MKLLTFCLVMLTTLVCCSQDGKFNFGARSAGMAGSSITLADEYSLFNNIGGIGKVSAHSVFAGYQNRYGIPEFQVIGGGAIYHSSVGNAGVGYYKFGDHNFSQQRIHLAVGNAFQMVSLGLGADLIQYTISAIGTRHVLALQFGGVAEITSKIHLGAHIFNINQAKIDEGTSERVPTLMKTGLSYRPSNELMINVEVEKDLDFEELVKLGMEYEVVTDVFLRTGLTTEPLITAFGIGFHPQNLQFDYAFSNDSRLGNTHDVSIAYSFRK